MPILTSLIHYPIKSCGGISLREATLTAAGLMSANIYDREWMVVDADGMCISQREYPAMACITPSIKADTLELRAPSMLRLEIPLDLPHPDDAPTLEVDIWGTTLIAYDCDALTAAWFSNAIGTACRLVRFHPHAKRFASAKWTGEVAAPTLFSDEYPVLIISEASLDDLNQKLAVQGREALPMNRFRPNIVISGVEAFEEDYAASIRIGKAVLKPVKPCARCTIPSVDQTTGIVGSNPLDVLQIYRANPIVDGGITFGMNAILLEGENQLLRVGDEVSVNLAFD